MFLPRLLAMLSIQPPIVGDEALLRLAQARFTEAGIGGEFYPGSVEHMVALFDYRPPTIPCTAHLPRAINILEAAGQSQIVDYATCAAGRLYAILIHDHRDFANDRKQTVSAFRDVNNRLVRIPDAPLLFVEFAAGLDTLFFADLFETTVELEQICPAIDISHVGIHLCKKAYADTHAGENVCALRPDSPDLPAKIEEIQSLVATARIGVIDLTDRLGQLQKPLHFHLHDGHPLSTFSQFGVSDHLSFLQSIPIPFPHQGTQLLTGIFGIDGLRQLIQTARQRVPAENLSFMLEIHPQAGRSSLGNHTHLFAHWQDLSHAEQMNYWLDSLLNNARLVQDAFLE